MNVQKRKHTLATVMIAYFMTGFMGSAMIVAVPVIGLDLDMSVTMTGWVISGFVLASAILLMPAGRFADYLGHSLIFKTGIAFFALTTLACAFATGGSSLIFYRFLQGLASALIYCSGMAIVSSVYPPNERGMAIGWVTFMVYMGLSIGPVIGGFLNGIYGWRSILHITWILTTPLTIYAFFVLKETGAKGKKVKDFVGMLLFMLMVLLIFGGLSVPDIRGYSAFAAGLVVMLIMTAYEYKHPEPLIDVRLFFGNRLFGSANAASMLNYSATSGVLFLISIELQLNYGLTSEKAGLIMLAQPLAMMLVTPIAGKLADKRNPKKIAFTGMILIGTVLTVMAFAENSSLYFVTTMLFILGFGIGIFSTPNNTVIMNSVTKEYYGFASSTLSTMRLMGQTFSIAASIIILNYFAGSTSMDEMNLEGLVKGFKVAFMLFAIICFSGALLSLAGKQES